MDLRLLWVLLTWKHEAVFLQFLAVTKNSTTCNEIRLQPSQVSRNLCFHSFVFPEFLSSDFFSFLFGEVYHSSHIVLKFCLLSYYTQNIRAVSLLIGTQRWKAENWANPGAAAARFQAMSGLLADGYTEYSGTPPFNLFVVTASLYGSKKTLWSTIINI